MSLRRLREGFVLTEENGAPHGVDAPRLALG
jgi:hypothetical protein